MTSASPAGSADGRRRRSTFRFVRDLLVIVVIALLASFLIKTFLVRSFYIPSASMEDTLLGEPGHHDRILVDELVPNMIPLQRGDVIVFTDPGEWLQGEQAATAPSTSPVAVAAERVLSLVGLSGQDSNDHLVKRVIGLPGDQVTCCNALGHMSVNGVSLREPYAHVPAGSTDVSRDPFTTTVPAGGVWVMGDNRYNSSDSRFHTDTPTHGAVPITDIVGRAFVVSWPVDRWAWLSNYPDTFDAIPTSSHK